MSVGKEVQQRNMKQSNYGEITHCKPITKGCGNYHEQNACQNDEIEIDLPTDADEKLIGMHLTWEDEPVEI